MDIARQRKRAKWVKEMLGSPIRLGESDQGRSQSYGMSVFNRGTILRQRSYSNGLKTKCTKLKMLSPGTSNRGATWSILVVGCGGPLVQHGTSTRNAKGPPLMDKGPWLAAPVEVLRRCESFVHETRSFGAQIEVLCGAATQGLWGVPVETKFRTKHFEFGAFIEPFDQNLEHHSPI